MLKCLLSVAVLLLGLAFVFGVQPVDHFPRKPVVPEVEKHKFGVEADRLAIGWDLARVASNIDRAVSRLDDANRHAEKIEIALRYIVYSLWILTAVLAFFPMCLKRREP